MEFIYTMYRVDKFYGPDRQVLANISLSLPSGREDRRAGTNGAGKSTLLRIMAGLDEPSAGVAELAPAAPSAFSRRSPSSTRARTCAGTSRTAYGRCATCSTAST